MFRLAAGGYIAACVLSEHRILTGLATFVSAFGTSTLFIMFVMRLTAGRFASLPARNQNIVGFFVYPLTVLVASVVAAAVAGTTAVAASISAGFLFAGIVLVTASMRAAIEAERVRYSQFIR
jgi:hypothetical protein